MTLFWTPWFPLECHVLFEWPLKCIFSYIESTSGLQWKTKTKFGRQDWLLILFLQLFYIKALKVTFLPCSITETSDCIKRLVNKWYRIKHARSFVEFPFCFDVFVSASDLLIFIRRFGNADSARYRILGRNYRSRWQFDNRHCRFALRNSYIWRDNLEKINEDYFKKFASFLLFCYCFSGQRYGLRPYTH